MPLFVLLCRADTWNLKSFITIFLFLAILIQTFSSFVYDAAYVLNKNYIATKLCINKDKPIMHCNGKCFLAKQQQQEEQRNDKSADTRKEKFEIQFFSLPSAIILETIFSKNDIIYNDHVSFSLPDFHTSVFHPPSA
jgi:hypothetical protein